MILDFNRSWWTYPTPEPEEWHLPRSPREVDLPHDDNIRYDTAADHISSHAGAYYPGCSTEYEKTLTVDEAWRNKRISLAFDGVYHNAVVRVNHQFVHRGHYGYTAFQCDLTPFLHVGENLIRVSAANRDVPNSRWYTGTGIFRGVELLVQDHVFLPWRGTALVTALKDGYAEVTARVEICNETDVTVRRNVRITLEDAQGIAVAGRSAPAEIAPGCTMQAEVMLPVSSPRLWSDEDPYLYQARVELLDGSIVTDESRISYGLRTLAWNAREGLLLNGRSIKLRGGCIHHDHGILGAASHAMAEERKIRALKASGFNAIRSAHNPASDALLQACDKYGMLVMDEAFDMWREPKMPYDNSAVFDLTWRIDVEAMVRRDRNHACVVMYSTGNEIPERDGHSGGNQLAREIADTFRALDPSRPVTNALNNVSPQGNVNGIEANLLSEQDYFLTATQAYAQPLDIVGYNYMRDRLEKDHSALPERIICASETVGCDIYHGWEMVKKCPWVIGDFMWTAVDYLGEVGVGRTEVDERPMGLADYPYRISGCGDLDLCCRKKPRSYYRDCVWGIATRPYLAVEDPALYEHRVYPMWWGWPLVQEYWNYPGWEGKPVRVCVYTQAEEVALLLNGQEMARTKTREYKADFEIAYHPGEITAVEYSAGQEGARHTVCTPDEKRMICLTPDKPALDSSVDDLVFVDAQLTDSRGRPILEHGRRITFGAEGGVVFMGAGSSAIKTTDNYANPSQTMEGGHVQAVFRVIPGAKGCAKITCCAEGLPDAETVIKITEQGNRKHRFERILSADVQACLKEESPWTI